MLQYSFLNDQAIKKHFKSYSLELKSKSPDNNNIPHKSEYILPHYNVTHLLIPSSIYSPSIFKLCIGDKHIDFSFVKLISKIYEKNGYTVYELPEKIVSKLNGTKMHIKIISETEFTYYCLMRETDYNAISMDSLHYVTLTANNYVNVKSSDLNKKIADGMYVVTSESTPPDFEIIIDEVAARGNFAPFIVKNILYTSDVVYKTLSVQLVNYFNINKTVGSVLETDLLPDIVETIKSTPGTEDQYVYWYPFSLTTVSHTEQSNMFDTNVGIGIKNLSENNVMIYVPLYK
jgi:hypothetical protein